MRRDSRSFNKRIAIYRTTEIDDGFGGKIAGIPEKLISLWAMLGTFKPGINSLTVASKSGPVNRVDIRTSEW